MNIEERIDFVMTDPNSRDKDVFHSLFMVIQTLLASDFGLANFCGEYYDKDWVLGISFKVPHDVNIPIVGDKEFDEILSITKASIKSYYDRPLDEIINYAACIIGVPKDTVDKCSITCKLDPYQNNDLCLRDRKLTNGKQYVPYYIYLKTYREYNIVVKMPDDVAGDIKQFNSCKFFEYAALIIYIMLVSITGGKYENELKDRIECIVNRAASYNKEDANNAQNDETSEENTQDSNEKK